MRIPRRQTVYGCRRRGLRYFMRVRAFHCEIARAARYDTIVCFARDLPCADIFFTARRKRGTPLRARRRTAVYENASRTIVSEQAFIFRRRDCGDRLFLSARMRRFVHDFRRGVVLYAFRLRLALPAGSALRRPSRRGVRPARVSDLKSV